MKVILVDNEPKKFYPLTLTRSLTDVLVGCSTIKDKWLCYVDNIDVCAEKHLQGFYPYMEKEAIYVDSRVIPNEDFIEALKALKVGEGLKNNKLNIAHKGKSVSSQGVTWKEYMQELSVLHELTDLFRNNEQWINDDLSRFKSKYTKLSKASEGVTITGDNVYLAQNVSLEPCIINSKAGPVIIDEGAEIWEGCMLRGPLYIGKGTILKMGAKVYGASSFGEQCRVGGEVNNSVMQGFSNKGHDGFLGNSILGAWCNLGADTNNSNLKNNYGEVKRWSYLTEDFEATGLQFCGLIMGDHSKSSINTMFNTGTTVGVSSNIFASKFPPKYIPSFAWMDDKQVQRYQVDKAKETAKEVMNRRHVEFTEAHSKLFDYLYQLAI